MKNNIYMFLTLINFILLPFSCREEIALETETFESVLVVEATITNELKRQEVKISRTFLLEDSEQILENNADVSVTDSTGNSFSFSQNTDSVYVSDIAFEALPDIEYTLVINTADGKTYSSNQQTLTPISQIDNLRAEFVDDNVNGPGVQVFVDSNNPNSDVQYFRYEYEETYKIIVPFNNLIGVNFTNFIEVGDLCGKHVFYDVEFFEKTEEEGTCFSSNKNLNILQTTSTNLSDNNILRFPIRFLADDVEDDIIDTSILRERYSIKVRQYIQNIEAYNYYRILSLLGDTESVLSETQPGFLESNLTVLNADSNRVIGFFEVASVSEQRVFFNYQDVNIPLPNYIFSCDERIYDFNDNIDSSNMCDDDENERNSLYLFVNNEYYKLINYDEETDIYKIAKQEMC
ncbi:DUF4249 domain-containing protein [Lacinutrix sp.]|uniref:DUF4249 domain-containing protein n=1 Tax=Lacinutrix sp. TaxID=1937692 RepID=UPI0025BD9171|nr:DUF4249 domain-containing protein [Lacinutrix sp.]